MKNILPLSLSLALAAALSACGAGGEEEDQVVATTSGVFRDAPVSGLWYQSLTGNGYTNSKGEFPYKPGEVYTFFVGQLKLGSYTPGTDNAIVTPASLVPAGTPNREDIIVNMARFLMTLDINQDPSDGIEIERKIDAAATGWPAINFATGLDADTATSKPQLILTGNGDATYPSIRKYYASRTYSTKPEARTHLQDSMGCAYAGGYFATRTVAGVQERVAFALSGDGAIQALQYIPAPTPAVARAYTAAAGSFSYANLLSADGAEKELDSGGVKLVYKHLLSEADRVYVKAGSDFTTLSRIGGKPSAQYRLSGILTVPRAAGENHYVYVMDVNGTLVSGRIVDIHTGTAADLTGTLNVGNLSANSTLSGRSLMLSGSFAAGSLTAATFKETDGGVDASVAFTQTGCKLN